MKLSFKSILPIILISALLILLAGCFGVPTDESPGYTPGAISGTIARPEVCCGEPSESSLVGNAISPNVCDVLTLCNPQNTADWYAWANVEVTLTTWVDCEEIELASTTTDENGDYLFSDVPAGKNYIITAICPEEIDFKVKDVAEEVVEGATYDAGISDAESTVLALCLEGLGEICLDSDILDLNDFRNHFKYETVICEVCDKLAECLYAIPVWVCEITELCPGYTPTGDDDDECESSPTANAGSDQEFQICDTGDVVSVYFTGSGTTEEPPLSYAWDFGDGDSSTLEDPSHTYLYPFSSPYTVTLTVTDECGNSAVDETTVTITECINNAPKVDGLPTRQAISAVSYQSSCIPTYRFIVSKYASDDVGDILTYSFVGDKPTGMKIDEGSGEIVWDPYCVYIGERCHQCGDVCVTVRVQDNGCCQPSYTDVKICIEVWNGWIDTGAYVGIGFEGCPIGKYACP